MRSLSWIVLGLFVLGSRPAQEDRALLLNVRIRTSTTGVSSGPHLGSLLPSTVARALAQGDRVDIEYIVGAQGIRAVMIVSGSPVSGFVHSGGELLVWDDLSRTYWRGRTLRQTDSSMLPAFTIRRGDQDSHFAGFVLEHWVIEQRVFEIPEELREMLADVETGTTTDVWVAPSLKPFAERFCQLLPFALENSAACKSGVVLIQQVRTQGTRLQMEPISVREVAKQPDSIFVVPSGYRKLDAPPLGPS